MKILCALLFVCNLVGAGYTVDGDTIHVGSQSVRLAGVDSEELNEPNGPAAKAAMRQIIQGHTITCEPQGKSYNRIVATCHTEAGLNINAEIIRQGYALDCARYSNGIYRKYEPEGARAKLIQKPYC